MVEHFSVISPESFTTGGFSKVIGHGFSENSRNVKHNSKFNIINTVLQ